MRHLPAIDGLRAIAVLAVVAYHAGLPVPAGFIGVDVFFVISGYVITRMLAEEHRRTGAIDLLGFYARRARRILPALLVVVAVTLAAAALLLGTTAQAAVVSSAMAAMGMVANLHFQAVTGGYFDASADQMPLLHLWSLAVEEQFYFVWPLLMVAVLRFRRGPWLLAGLAAASFLLAQAWTTGGSAEVAFYQMPARFWELAIGGLIALAPAQTRPVMARAGLLLLLVAVAIALPDFPGVGAAPAVLGSALVLHAAHGGLRIPMLELPPLRYVGLISYSLYLWHWPLLAIHKAASFDPPTLPASLALCAAAFVLAALSYRYIETPFRRVQTRKAKVIGAGVIACVVLAGCAGAMGAALPTTDLAARTAADFRKVDACHQQPEDRPALPATACGDGGVVLWGDSHAYAWRPYAERLGPVVPLTRAACPPGASPRHRELCAQFNALAVERAKQGKIVVLSAAWLRWFTNRDGLARDTRDGLASALAAVAPHVQQVIVLGPLPVMQHDPQLCIAKDRLDACAMPRTDFDRQAAGARAFLQAEAAKYPNVRYVDPAPFFCNATDCPLLRDGRSLYWDDDHIAASAARDFTPNR